MLNTLIKPLSAGAALVGVIAVIIAVRFALEKHCEGNRISFFVCN